MWLGSDDFESTIPRYLEVEPAFAVGFYLIDRITSEGIDDRNFGPVDGLKVLF